MADEVQAVSRLASYPLVSDSLAKLTKVYQDTKDKSSLIRLGCSVAETGFQAAVHVARPILRQLDTPAVNNLACQQLNKLESAFPVITKPTDVVLDEAKARLVKVVQPTVDSVKVKVNAVRELEEKMVGGIKTYTSTAVDSAKSYGLASINGLASAAGLNRVLDVAESMLDSYLPAEAAVPADVDAPGSSSSSNRDDEESDEDDVQKAVPEQQQELPPLERVRVVSQKVKQRAYQRAMLRLRGLQLRSTETLQKLNFTVDLIAYAKQNMDVTTERVQLKALEVRTRVRCMYDQLTAACAAEDGAQAEDDATGVDREGESASRPDALERKVLRAARSLALRAQSAMHQLSAFAGVLPAAALNQVKEMEQLAESMYQNVAKATGFGDISVALLQVVKAKAQGVLDFSQRLTEMVASQAPSFVNLEKAIDWMVPDIQLDGLEIEPPEVTYQWRIDVDEFGRAQSLAGGSVQQ